jgi:hypothetical protein
MFAKNKKRQESRPWQMNVPFKAMEQRDECFEEGDDV